MIIHCEVQSFSFQMSKNETAWPIDSGVALTMIFLVCLFIKFHVLHKWYTRKIVTINTCTKTTFSKVIQNIIRKCKHLTQMDRKPTGIVHSIIGMHKGRYVFYCSHPPFPIS